MANQPKGCPRCGSHDTDNVRQEGGAQWCNACGWRWTPCGVRFCRGWRLDLQHREGPCVLGCDGCGVSTPVARSWPESHRALALALQAYKHTQTVASVLGRSIPKHPRDIIRSDEE